MMHTLLFGVLNVSIYSLDLRHDMPWINEKEGDWVVVFSRSTNFGDISANERDELGGVRLRFSLSILMITIITTPIIILMDIIS